MRTSRATEARSTQAVHWRRRAGVGLLVAALAAAGQGCTPIEPPADDTTACDEATRGWSECVAGASGDGACDERAARVGQACGGASEAVSSEARDDVDSRVLGPFLSVGDRCYAAGNVTCVRGVFRAIALAMRARGYPTAARMLLNFVTCDEPVVTLTDDELAELRADPALQMFVADGEHAAVVAAQQAADRDGVGVSAASAELRPTVLMPLEDENLRYAFGRFTVAATGAVRFVDGSRFRATTTYALRDRYDWNPERRATASSYGSYHTWGAWMMSRGEACAFDVRAQWTLETLGAVCNRAAFDACVAGGEAATACAVFGGYDPVATCLRLGARASTCFTTERCTPPPSANPCQAPTSCVECAATPSCSWCNGVCSYSRPWGGGACYSFDTGYVASDGVCN